MPHGTQAQVGGGYEETVVNPLLLARHEAHENRRTDDAQAPVDPGQAHRHKGHHGDGALVAFGNAGQAVEKPAENRGGGQDVARHDDQAHLHAEGEQHPETAAPVLDELKSGGFGENET